MQPSMALNKTRAAIFGISIALAWLWIDSWLRSYSSVLVVMIQTVLVATLVTWSSRRIKTLALGIATAVLAGWLASIFAHQIMSLLFVPSYWHVWIERYQLNVLSSYIWFVAYSSLLFGGVVQAVLLLLLLRTKAEKGDRSI
ncbi:hypothetical protein HPT27_03110 [Permianibacter sp. IMCC34836]|uniref:hypothetical protein n=1 Tax=Permianibacter fluminis TaxID=2738515 RepID=UPI0015539D73|nr:hypothetical protein [Permianibacter fluminis]NQD35997.1 hypothetical protein [Permianibacter fluminis]